MGRTIAIRHAVLLVQLMASVSCGGSATDPATQQRTDTCNAAHQIEQAFIQFLEKRPALDVKHPEQAVIAEIGGMPVDGFGNPFLIQVTNAVTSGVPQPYTTNITIISSMGDPQHRTRDYRFAFDSSTGRWSEQPAGR